MKKLTKEQLAIVLQAHDEGRLVRGGYTNAGAGGILPFCGKFGCINQVVYDVGSFALAASMNQPIADWFDTHYDRDWTRAKFEEKLREQGFVEE